MDRFTQQELLDAMGSLTTEAEAEAMREMLAERGIYNCAQLAQMDDSEFFGLIPEAIQRAKQADAS